MPDIPLELIRPNPFRDFDLHPYDAAQVERLQTSIRDDGFWASVVAREVDGTYQIAFGHHRIEAARNLGLSHVPIEVRELSDWKMVRMLASENAMQRGSTAAAALDAIAAISRVVAFECFRGDATQVSINIETSLEAAQSIWGKVRKGSGPGEPCLIALTPRGAFTIAQVRIALGVLKDSGRMARILTEARAAAEATAPAASIAEAPSFDARCARLFRLDSHLAEFRRIVTSEGVRSYLPVTSQLAFAQQLVDDLGEREMTAISLRERANVLLYENLGMSRADMRTSRKRITDDRVRDALNLLRRGVYDLKRGCVMLGVVFDDDGEISAEGLAQAITHRDEAFEAFGRLPLPAPNKRRRLRLITKEGGGA